MPAPLDSSPSRNVAKTLVWKNQNVLATVGEKIENTITRFDRIRECERQTDSQTDAARRHKPRFHSIAPKKTNRRI